MPALWEPPIERAAGGYTLARVLTEQSRFDEALQAGREASDAARYMGMTTLETACCSAQAWAFHDSGRHVEAAAMHGRAAELARLHCNRLPAVASSANQAMCLLHLGQAETARDALRAALRPPVLECTAIDCTRAILARALFLLGHRVEGDGVLGVYAERPADKIDPGSLVAQARAERGA